MQVFGCADKSISPYLKAWIKPDGGDSAVVGLVGPGTSRQLQANWNSPFEQSSVGSVFEKTAGLVQATTDRTAVTTLNSEQVWEGNRPHSFNLVLIFSALSDARAEVVQPLALLEQWASPQVNVVSPVGGGGDTGRIPSLVTVNIGRTSVLTGIVIENINVPLDRGKSKDGYLVYAEATLQIGTKQMLNASDILSSWGIGGNATLF